MILIQLSLYSSSLVIVLVFLLLFHHCRRLIEASLCATLRDNYRRVDHPYLSSLFLLYIASLRPRKKEEEGEDDNYYVSASSSFFLRLLRARKIGDSNNTNNQLVGAFIHPFGRFLLSYSFRVVFSSVSASSSFASFFFFSIVHCLETHIDESYVHIKRKKKRKVPNMNKEWNK